LHLPTRHQLSPWVVPPIPQSVELVSGERIALRYWLSRGWAREILNKGETSSYGEGGMLVRPSGPDGQDRHAGLWGRSSSPALRDGAADRRSPPGLCVTGQAEAWCADLRRGLCRAAQATVRDEERWV